MERMQLKPRQGWQQQFEQLGFTYHSIDDLYWDERYAYRFTSDQIDHLESVTEELHQMALQAVGQVVREGSYEKFAIPEAFWKKIEDSWLAGEFSLYGRFDLSWNGSGEPEVTRI
jgi:glutathionylspermidine synthase